MHALLERLDEYRETHPEGCIAEEGGKYYFIQRPGCNTGTEPVEHPEQVVELFRLGKLSRRVRALEQDDTESVGVATPYHTVYFRTVARKA